MSQSRDLPAPPEHSRSARPPRLPEFSPSPTASRELAHFRALKEKERAKKAAAEMKEKEKLDAMEDEEPEAYLAEKEARKKHEELKSRMLKSQLGGNSVYKKPATKSRFIGGGRETRSRKRQGAPIIMRQRGTLRRANGRLKRNRFPTSTRIYCNHCDIQVPGTDFMVDEGKNLFGTVQWRKRYVVLIPRMGSASTSLVV